MGNGLAVQGNLWTWAQAKANPNSWPWGMAWLSRGTCGLGLRPKPIQIHGHGEWPGCPGELVDLGSGQSHSKSMAIGNGLAVQGNLWTWAQAKANPNPWPSGMAWLSRGTC